MRVPTVSPAQHRLMEAAAHTPGGYGGVPQSVGKEFVEKDSADDAIPDTDFSIAEAIRDRRLPSPQKFGEFWLFALRITGTGAAWRESLGEWAFRDPEDWLSEEFVQRCNGLSVIFVHPEGAGLNTEEFRQRAIGTVILPYVEGDEVWGIAKIFDADAAELMQGSYRSTSPGVVPPEDSQAITLENGNRVLRVLAEGLPKILDHLAVCQAGVWDKNGQPSGVRLDSIIQKGDVVADKSEREQELEKELEATRKERDDAKSRLDAAEGERKEREEREEKERADARRKDETDEEAMKAGEEGKADAKRNDARKRHHDAKKHDGAVKDCARCDAELEEFERLDAAAEHEVEAGKGTEEVAHALKDSKEKIRSMEQQIADLQRAARPLSMTERDELSKALHRYDSLFQMLLDETPQPIPGETPIAYRKRAANSLRKYTQSFKTYAFHDAQQTTDFGLVEEAIIREATEYAKNPPAEALVGRVQAIKDTVTMPGKVITRFVGDQSVVWAPFTAPAKRFLKHVRTQPHRAAY